MTFRYLPRRGDPDAFNRKLVDAVQRDGRVFISSTMIDGTFTLRLAVLSLRTHLETIDLAIEILREKAGQLEGERQPTERTGTDEDQTMPMSDSRQ